MSAGRTIFVVEDDLKIARITADLLASNGHVARIFPDARMVLDEARKTNPAAVILDVMLPAGNGIDLCRQLRAFYAGPILMLTARIEESDKLHAFDIGADDYIAKPFSPAELLARVNALIRRSEGRLTSDPEGQAYLVDMSGSRIAWQGQWLELSHSEFRILAVLLKNPERIFPRSLLLDQLGDSALETGERAIDSHIKNIRKKLAGVREGGGRITSVYGAGYKFTPE
jgi:two-component system, OmpR family, response regulator BaeR